MEAYGRAGEDTGSNITLYMHFACWVTEAINAHPEYVIFIAFPLQQCLHERASMLIYSYIACLVQCSTCLLLSVTHLDVFFSLTRGLLMSYIYIYIYIYIYGAPILDVSRSHTTTHHSR